MRSIATAAATTLASGTVPMVLLVEMAFDPVLYLCTAGVPIVWGGNTYLGAGPLGAVDVVRDTSGDAQSLSFSLEGVTNTTIALALGVSARNRACNVRLAVLNATTHAIEDVVLLGAFVLDQITLGAGALSVTALPMARVFSRPKAVRYTDEDQQRISAGDRALQYVVSQAAHPDVWPAASWGRR